jgi:mRNA-degrading endonuclease toxin of MazEF toxin-antitoxin module
MQPESPPGRTSPRQRALILGAAALGLVALVVAVALGTPFGGRAGTPPPAVVLAPPGASTTTRAGGGAAAAAPATTTTTTPTATALALTAKDPFRPLVGSGATATTSPGGVTATTAASGGSSPGGGASTGSSPGGGASTGRKLTLLSVFVSGGKRYVRVDLDGKRYQAAEGGTIAGAYRVVDVGTSCAEFRSTSGTAFTLCEGEAVLK